MLDLLDKKIISLLEYDARIPTTQMARKLKTSQQVINYRLKKLEKTKVIGEYYTAINFSVFGYTSYRTLIQINEVSEEKHKKFIEYMHKMENVLWFVECGGRWDYIVNIMAKNVAEFDNLFQKLRIKFADFIQDYTLVLTVSMQYYGRNYYFPQPIVNEKTHTLGINPNKIEYDQKDIELLKILARNARMHCTKIGEKIKLTPVSVIQRMKKLQKMQIIQAHKPLIQLENTGYKCYKALLNLHNLNIETEKNIDTYLKNIKNVVGYLKMVGPWNFEIEFEMKDDKEMLSFIRKFRHDFKDVVKDLEILPLYHEYFYNYMPDTL